MSDWVDDIWQRANAHLDSDRSKDVPGPVFPGEVCDLVTRIRVVERERDEARGTRYEKWKQAIAERDEAWETLDVEREQAVAREAQILDLESRLEACERERDEARETSRGLHVDLMAKDTEIHTLRARLQEADE